MQKDFITVTPDTGGGSATLNAVAAANSGGARSTSITIAGSGISKTIDISQVAGLIDFDGAAGTLVVGNNRFTFVIQEQTGKNCVAVIAGCVATKESPALAPYMGFYSINNHSDLLGELGAMTKITLANVPDITDTGITKVTDNPDFKYVYQASTSEMITALRVSAINMWMPPYRDGYTFTTALGYTFYLNVNQAAVGFNIGGFAFMGFALNTPNLICMNTGKVSSKNLVLLAWTAIAAAEILTSITINGQVFTLNLSLQKTGTNGIKSTTMDAGNTDDIEYAINQIAMGDGTATSPNATIIFRFSNGATNTWKINRQF